MLSDKMLKNSKFASGITSPIAREEGRGPGRLFSLHATERSGRWHCQQTQDVKGRGFLVDEADACLAGIAFVRLDKHTDLFAHVAMGCLERFVSLGASALNWV